MPEQPTLAPVATEAVAITPEATGTPAPDYELATKFALMTQYPPPPTRTPSAPFTYASNNPGVFDFLNEHQGWLMVNNTVQTTTNGGMDWSTDASDTNLLYTSDGGSTWQTISKVTGDSISFVSPTDGWMAGSGRLYITHDGGVSWQAVDTPVFDQTRWIQFVDAANGWIEWHKSQAEELRLSHTTDGGSTWLEVGNPCTQGLLSGSYSFISPTTGWMMCGWVPSAGHQGKSLYRTEDGGANWEKIAEASFDVPYEQGKLSTGGYVGHLDFVDEKYGWFEFGRHVDGGVTVTTDGGVTWNYERGLRTPHGRAVLFQFLSRSTGYAIEYAGDTRAELEPDYTFLMVKTTDAGANWTQVYPPLHSKPSP